MRGTVEACGSAPRSAVGGVRPVPGPNPVEAFTHGYSNHHLRALVARPDVTLALDQIIVELTPVQQFA